MSGGGSGHSGGGGGSSGKVEWPSYLQNSHKRFLNTGVTSSVDLDDLNSGSANMETAVFEGWNNSPYQAAVAFNPETALGESQNRLDELESQISGFDNLLDYEEAWNKAWGLINDPETGITDAKVQAAVEAYEARQMPGFMRGVGRFCASMADIGAYNSSAFLLGQALMENEFQANLANYHAGLSLENYKMKIASVLPMAERMVSNLVQRIEFERAATTLQGELNRIRIVAMREFYDDELENLIKDSTWNFELLNHAATMIGAIQGGGGGVSPSQRKATSGISMLGGAISGATSGAMAGSAFGPWGAAIGGTIGAVSGAAGSR